MQELAKLDAKLVQLSSSKRQQLQERLEELDDRLTKLQEEQRQLKTQQEEQNSFAAEVLAGLHNLQALHKQAQKEVTKVGWSVGWCGRAVGLKAGLCLFKAVGVR